jgi:hypothetical protein
MPSKNAARHSKKKEAESAGRGKRRIRSSAIAVILVVVAVSVWWGLTRGRSEDHDSDRPAGGNSSALLSSPETAQKLVGRWQRTDAGYVIEIRSIDRFGTVDAVYLNPNPIHVSQALASDASGALDLFIELMDVGYPGATYKLRYIPDYDALAGVYHQPTAGQDFEVVFNRK